jgi:hypothetical protein
MSFTLDQVKFIKSLVDEVHVCAGDKNFVEEASMLSEIQHELWHLERGLESSLNVPAPTEDDNPMGDPVDPSQTTEEVA